MDFTFSADQDALRESVRSFLADRSPSAYVRAMGDDERGFDASARRTGIMKITSG